jgi:hypothetical protein
MVTDRRQAWRNPHENRNPQSAIRNPNAVYCTNSPSIDSRSCKFYYGLQRPRGRRGMEAFSVGATVSEQASARHRVSRRHQIFRLSPNQASLALRFLVGKDSSFLLAPRAT